MEQVHAHHRSDFLMHIRNNNGPRGSRRIGGAVLLPVLLLLLSAVAVAAPATQNDTVSPAAQVSNTTQRPTANAAPLLSATAACSDGSGTVWPDCSLASPIASVSDATERAAVASAADLHPVPRNPRAQDQADIAWGLVNLDMPEDDVSVLGYMIGGPDTNPAAPATPPAARSNPLGRTEAMLGTVRISLAFRYALAALVGLWAAWQARRVPRWIVQAMRRAGRWFDAQALGVRRLVTVEEIDPASTLSPLAVSRRGWSPEAMERLLGRPDYAVVDPQGLREPIILLCRQRVEMLEQSEEFRRYCMQQTQRMRATTRQIDKWVALRNATGVWPSPV